MNDDDIMPLPPRRVDRLNKIISEQQIEIDRLEAENKKLLEIIDGKDFYIKFLRGVDE